MNAICEEIDSTETPLFVLVMSEYCLSSLAIGTVLTLIWIDMGNYEKSAKWQLGCYGFISSTDYGCLHHTVERPISVLIMQNVFHPFYLLFSECSTKLEYIHGRDAK